MIWQSMKMAWQAIASNKLRSFLTMLGIIIGVTALVVMVTLVNGAAGRVTDEISSLGADRIMARVFDDKGKPLKLRDLEELGQDESIKQYAPEVSASLKGRSGYRNCTLSLTGTTAPYADIIGLKMEYGRFLKNVDDRNATEVAVLSYEAKEKLFGKGQTVGSTVRIGERMFRVIGVLEKDDSNMAMLTGRYGCYVPFSVLSRMIGQPEVAQFNVTAASESASEAAEKAVRNYLMERFNQDDDAFYVQSMTAIMDAMSSVMGTMKILLGSIAAISLLVGGIGIMNIMLVSVTERTKEIGIRKAIGAGRGSIMLQFLIEAVTVSLLGCLFGLLLSQGILFAVGTVSRNLGNEISFTMTYPVIALAVGFSSAVGIVFGLYPANKAAKLPPIEALRYQG